MKNLSIPSKKEILIFLDNFNTFFSNSLNKLNLKNFKNLFKTFFHDKRFVITIFIVFFSIFAHLSTPAFYQDGWVLNKIKKQLEKEYDISFLLPKEVNYSMFPIPSFILYDVGFVKDDREFGKIQKMQIYLSFSKFLNKEKINIQDIYISNSKYEIYKKDIKNLLKFFDKEISQKKLFIKNSKIFLKDNNEDVFLILTLKNSVSYFDKKKINNILNIYGELFNNSINFKLSNNYLSKSGFVDTDIKTINHKIKINFDYLKSLKKITVENIVGSNSYLTNISFNNDDLVFSSNSLYKDKFKYKGKINFKPFFSDIIINLKEIDLYKLMSTENFFFNILDSEIISDKNLNYKIEINSDKISNHRLLKNFIFCLTFNQKRFSFDNTKLIFDNNVKIKVKDSEFISNKEKKYFSGELNFDIKDENKLFSFFQTRKENRKELNNISIFFRYDLNKKYFFIERINLNGKTNDEIQNTIESFNRNEVKSINRIVLKKLFNDLTKSL